MSEQASPKRISWIYSVLPIAVATGPLGTLVQLYLIQLDGLTLGTLYGSVAAAIFNGVSIPASLFWGYTTDKIHNRRLLIAASYALMGLVLVSFYFDTTNSGTIARYSVFSFVSVASATPLNLLIMEKEKKNLWAATFARLSMISGIGNVGGLIISTVWSSYLPGELTLLFIPMGLFALASAGLSLATISEPAFVLERETVALRRPSLFSRLLANSVFFVVVPKVSDFRRIFRGLRSSLTSYVPLFFISTILFYLSSGLFNTSFVPSMNKAQLSDREVFVVILAGMVVQTVAFQLARKYVVDRPLIATSVQGLLLRGWSYVAVGAAAVFFTGPYFLGLVLVFFPLASGVAFAFYYTSANTMMFNTVKGRHAGAALGVYSAVVGIAAMLGSLVSGFISVYSGFYVTFILAGILLFSAVGVVARLPKTSATSEGPNQ